MAYQDGFKVSSVTSAYLYIAHTGNLVVTSETKIFDFVHDGLNNRPTYHSRTIS